MAETESASRAPGLREKRTEPLVTAGPVLDIQHLDVEYQTESGPVRAVRNFSLEVRAHESVGIVGESGSGKSTMALGAIRYLAENGRITGGRVLLNGRDLLELSRKELREVWGRSIGVVYQNPLNALNPSISIGKQLAETASLHLGMDRAHARDRAREMLTMVAMPDAEFVMKRYPHQLSGGMLQRCVIAMALMANPALVIMDEPTTALDVTTQAVVLDLVFNLKQEFESAILYITHDLGVVTTICDRVAVMYAGECMEVASLHSLFRRPLHPYTWSLLGCMPHFDRSARKCLLTTIPGSIPRAEDLPAGCVFAPRCWMRQQACEATRPPLAAAHEEHLTACRRWAETPSPDLGCRPPSHEGEVLQPGGDVEKRQNEALARVEGGAEVGHPLLMADGLHTYFRGQRTRLRWLRRGARQPVKAVDGIDLVVNVGETLGIVGESGSGKTTAVRAMIGLTPATEGEVRLGNNVLAPSIKKRSRNQLRSIQMVFQNPDASLNPLSTVGDAIWRPLRLFRGLGRGVADERVAELLAAVSLPPSFANRLPHELSGGEKQRVAIARALAADPDVVICDEPISSLDVSVQGTLINLLVQLQAERRIAYVFISHDLSAVQHLSDWIAVMYVGRLMELGRTAKVLNPPYHPYTEALLSAVPVADPDIKQARIRLRGGVPSAVDVPPGCRFHPRCPRFLGQACAEQEPPWREVAEGHWIYCHIVPSELAEMQADLLRDGDGDSHPVTR